MEELQPYITQKAPFCIFPVKNEATGNVVWFEIEPSTYGVYITVHKDQPDFGRIEHLDNAMATVHVDYFVDQEQQKEQVKLQLWDAENGPEGDPGWSIPDNYSSLSRDASIILVDDVQKWQAPDL